MRATIHSGRFANASGKHNDRSFDLDKAEHIDKSLTAENQNWCVYKNMTFDEAEHLFYAENFGEMINDINERAERSRHLERRTSADKLLKSKKTQPEEIIFQIGNKENCADRQILISVYNDFYKWHKKKFGEHVKDLDMSLHVDEASAHIHVRRVWVYDDSKGFKAIGQHKALEQMGYELPKPNEPRGRNNNLKMVYSAECREKWLDLCYEHGIEVEREPEKKPIDKQNLKKNDFIIQKQTELLEEKNQELTEVNDLIENEQAVLDELIDRSNEEGAILQNISVEIDNLSEEHQKLSEEHQNLSETHERLSKDVSQLKVFKGALENNIAVLEGKRDALTVDMMNLMRKFVSKPKIKPIFEKYCQDELERKEREIAERTERKSVVGTLEYYKEQIERKKPSSPTAAEHGQTYNRPNDRER